MAPRRLILQFGMGTSIRHRDYTGAARRAVEDAIRHNSIALAEYYGAGREDMVIEAEIGIAEPDAVDIAAVAACFPYGRVTVRAVPGGLDLAAPAGGATLVMANAAVSVSMAEDSA